MNYKLVCWADYSIPLGNWYNWMTIDKDGEVTFWAREPYTQEDFWYASTGMRLSLHGTGGAHGFLLTPPEPGRWSQQKYWIGD